MRPISIIALAVLLLFLLPGILVPPRLYAQEPEVIQLREAYRFPPSDEEDPLYYFAHISDIELLDNNLIAIADQFQYCVWIVQDDGTLEKKIGQRGQGPGEFERPWAVEWDSQSDILWVMDMGRIQAFSPEDWSYSHMIRPTDVNPMQMVAVGGKLMFTSTSQTRNDLTYVFDHEGNTLPSLGNHIEREVGAYGVRLHKGGRIDATLNERGELVICYVYRNFNDVLIVTGTTQATIHVDDKDISKRDRENRRRAKDWMDPSLGPAPSVLFDDVRISADHLFIYDVQSPGNRILEVDLTGVVQRVWMLPELEHMPLTFTIQQTAELPIIWAVWNFPDPHVKKLEPIHSKD